MADLLRRVFGLIDLRYKDMGDGSHAEVVSVDGVAVESYSVPVGAPVVGQAVIAVTGTAVALSAVALALPAGTVLVSALAANDATGGSVGGATVTDDVDGTGNGFILEAGKSTVVNADDLADVYVNGVAGDIFSFAAG